MQCNPHSRHIHSVTTRSRFFLSLASLILSLGGPAFALQTNQVEIGRNSNYDGTVKIYRDDAGRMLFLDNEVGTPVPLSALKIGKDVHGDLTGLNADDHPQYLNSTRHASTHNAAFNDALAITLDLGGNATLGDHVQDNQIHLKRADAESISGNWIFSGTPEFRGEIYLSHAGVAGDQLIRFEDGASDAQFFWHASSEQFELNRNVRLSGKLGIGIDPAVLLHLSENASITTLEHDNVTTASTSNKVQFTQRAKTDSQLRPALTIRSSFSTITDATRNSLVEFLTASAGTDAPALTLSGNDAAVADLLTVGTRAGIGAASPQTVLHAMASQAILRLSDSDSTTADTAQAWVEFYDRSVNRAGKIGYVQGNGELDIINDAESNAGIKLTTPQGGILFLTSAGPLGVGTTTPNDSAEITGYAGIAPAGLNLSNLSTNIVAGDTLGMLNFRGYDSSTNAAGVGAQIKGVADNTGHTANSRDTALAFSTTSGTSLVEAMRIDSDQNVSIANLTSGSVLFAGASGKVSQDNSGLYWDATNKRLGVGGQPQTRPLEIIGSATDVRFRVDNQNAFSTSNLASIEWNLKTSTQSRTAALLKASFTNTTDASRTSQMSLGVANAGGFNDVLFIVGNKVAIGTSTPTDKLTINGDLDVHGGNINTATGNLELDPNESGAGALKLGNLADGDTIEINGITDYKVTMGDGTANPATDAPVDWIQVKIAGTTRYIPVYN